MTKTKQQKKPSSFEGKIGGGFLFGLFGLFLFGVLGPSVLAFADLSLEPFYFEARSYRLGGILFTFFFAAGYFISSSECSR